MTTRRFEFVEGSSSKFWEITITGTEVRTSYGRIGSIGQTTTKDPGSAEGAAKLRDKLVREKTAKGYVEVGGVATSAASTTGAAASAAPGKAAAATTANVETSIGDRFARPAALAAVDACDEPDDHSDGGDVDATDVAIEARIARGVDHLDDDEKRSLIDTLCETRSFSDPIVAVRAFRWALEHRLEVDEVDGDTVTYFLARMLELTPDDDALLLEYLREVADNEYAYTDLRLGDLAVASDLAPARATRLALGHTFVEGFCLAISRTEPSPAEWVANALRAAFALAAEHGATEADWYAMRAELSEAGIADEERPRQDEWTRWAPK